MIIRRGRMGGKKERLGKKLKEYVKGAVNTKKVEAKEENREVEEN